MHHEPTSSPGRIVIIAALPREVRPLVKKQCWSQTHIVHAGRRITVFESAKAVILCAGIGAESARIATQAALEEYCPNLLISTGVAGSLMATLSAGRAFIAAHVIDAATGSSYPCRSGEWTLLTAATILGPEEKHNAAERFQAHAVDMEAAAVARVAAEAHIPFLAAKAISDEIEAALPPLNQFVQPDGQFAMRKFLLFAALHPASWPSIYKLARNSRKAAQALAVLLQNLIDNHRFAGTGVESKLEPVKP
jgi:adenosylhomocysteine nucleosidase